jgi:hypothetical protein
MNKALEFLRQRYQTSDEDIEKIIRYLLPEEILDLMNEFAEWIKK